MGGEVPRRRLRDGRGEADLGDVAETPSAVQIYFAILRSRSSAISDPQDAAWHVDRGRDAARGRVRSGRLLPRASSGSQLGPARAPRLPLGGTSWTGPRLSHARPRTR